MIVIDSTVLGDFLIGTPEIQKKIYTLQSIDPEWCSVSLWRFELGNILWKMISHRLITSEIAQNHLKNAENLIAETVVDIDNLQILLLAEQTKLTFYDASFVWLAQTRGLKLYTRDQEIIQKYPELALNTLDL